MKFDQDKKCDCSGEVRQGKRFCACRMTAQSFTPEEWHRIMTSMWENRMRKLKEDNELRD